MAITKKLRARAYFFMKLMGTWSSFCTGCNSRIMHLSASVNISASGLKFKISRNNNDVIFVWGFQDSIIYKHYTWLITIYRAIWRDRVQNSRNYLRAWVRAFPLSEYDQLGDYLLFNAYSAATHTTFGRRYLRQQIRAMQT